jgi:hypothetical protein
LKGGASARALRLAPRPVAKDAEKARRRELKESYNGIKLFWVAADEWLALNKLTLAPFSQRIERDNLKHLCPHFEKRLVTDIQASPLAEEASPKTINLEVGDNCARSSGAVAFGRESSRMLGCSRPSMTWATPSLTRKKPLCSRRVSGAAPARCTLPLNRP